MRNIKSMKFTLNHSLTEAPKLDLSALINGGVTVRAGEPILIELPITGAPTPTIEWTMSDKPLTHSVNNNNNNNSNSNSNNGNINNNNYIINSDNIINNN